VIRGEVVMVGMRSGVEYRLIREEWADQLEQFECAVFPNSNPDELCHSAEFAAMARDFTEGCFIGFDGDEIVAMGVGIRKRFDLNNPLHTLADIQPPGGGSGHVPDGAWYYGTTLAVKDSHQCLGIGKDLYSLRKGVCQTLNLAGIAAGGVIPGFADHKNQMTADQYIDAIRRRDLSDPTLSFQLDNGFEAVCALPNYVENPKVDNFAVLIVWHNPDYNR
jgi:hypothetical protein